MKKILITGTGGFIASHLVEHLLKNTDWEIIGIDRLDKISDLRRVGEVLDGKPQFRKRFKFIWHDLKSPISPLMAKEFGRINQIYHLAASSHVDDSIADPLLYVQDNVVGTVNLLNYARDLDSLSFYLQFSTDEVWSNAAEGISYKETDPYQPSNCYAATKASGDHLALAFAKTHKMPIIVSNMVNCFGERQDCRKMFPLFMKKILAGEKLYIHSYPKDSNGVISRPSVRNWIHCRNTAAACLFLSEKGVHGERYNIAGHKEANVLEMAQLIAKAMNMPFDYELVDFHSTRPQHDVCYRIDGSKLESLGFQYPVDFETSLEKTVKWTLENKQWLM